MAIPCSKDRVLCYDSENAGFYNDVNTKQDMHILHVIDAHTKENFVFFDDYDDRINKVHLGGFEGLKTGTIEDGMWFLRRAKCVIIQNGAGYDKLIFEKIYPEIWVGCNYFEKRSDPAFPYYMMDTNVMSCTLNPERRAPNEAFLLGMGNVGPHSIAAHGIRIGRHKPDHEDWTKLTLDMMHRVAEDTEIGLDLYHYLMREWVEQASRPNGKTKMGISQAYYCELRIAFAVARQANRGVKLDVGQAVENCTNWDKELEATERMCRPHMPKRMCMTKAKWSASQLSNMLDALTEQQMAEIQACTHISELTTVWSLTNKPSKQGCKIAASVTKHFPEMVGYKEVYGGDWQDAIVGGPFTPVRFEDIPLGNRAVVKEVLYKYGWRGVNLNDAELEHAEHYDKLIRKGHKKKAEEWGKLPHPWSGKIDEKSIERWEESDTPPPSWAVGIARWYIVRSRRTQILNIDDPLLYLEKGQWTSRSGVRKCRGLLPVAICQETRMTAQQYFEIHKMWPTDGHWRVPAAAFHAATNTFRMRHRNVVNIPSRGIYGPEMRRLFIAARHHKIIGCDGAGLELRMLAHFMGDDEYTDVILNGDIHTYNQGKANLPLRDMAKTFIYAFLYGSGLPNLARVCGVTEAVMKTCVGEFRASLPALDRLLYGVQKSAERGHLSALDGRWGRIRKRDGEYALNTALNVLLQMTGSVIMKWGHIIAEDMALEKGLIKTLGEFPMLIHMHDEAQMEELEAVHEYYDYTIPKEEWKSEEKAEYITEKGQWSAAEIVDEEDDMLLLRRTFSPLGDCYAQGIKLAGEMFGLRCPTAGEYKVGNDWYDCH